MMQLMPFSFWADYEELFPLPKPAKASGYKAGSAARPKRQADQRSDGDLRADVKFIRDAKKELGVGWERVAALIGIETPRLMQYQAGNRKQIPPFVIEELQKKLQEAKAAALLPSSFEQLIQMWCAMLKFSREALLDFLVAPKSRLDRWIADDRAPLVEVAVIHRRVRALQQNINPSWTPPSELDPNIFGEDFILVI